MGRPHASMKDREKSGPANKWMAAILTVTAILYARSLGNEFVLDDWEQIVRNRPLGDWSFVWKSLTRDILWFRDPFHLPQSPYYRPIHDLWLWFNFQLFGIHPIGWHAATIVLHLIVVWLVFRVTSILTAERRSAVVAAGIFALMPIHAEAVAWPAAVAPLLAAAFELGAFEYYLMFIESTGGSSTRNLALSIGLFGAALLTYESTIAFPLLVATHAFLFVPLAKEDLSGRGRSVPRFLHAIGAAWPYAVEVAAYLAIRMLVLGFIQPPPGNYLSRRMHLTAMQLTLAIPDAMATCATLLLMPWRAAPAHRLMMDVTGNVASPGFYVPTAAIAAVAGAGWLLLRGHPHRRLYLFCTAWVLISLAPMFHETGIFIQDRYLYFPSFGFCAMAADLTLEFARAGRFAGKAAAAACAVAAVIYGASLFYVQGFWHDDAAFYSQCVKEVPKMEPWHYQLGLALAARGDIAGAHREFETAAGLMHELLQNDPSNADARNALSAALAADQRYAHESDEGATAR